MFDSLDEEEKEEKTVEKIDEDEEERLNKMLTDFRETVFWNLVDKDQDEEEEDWEDLAKKAYKISQILFGDYFPK